MLRPYLYLALLAFSSAFIASRIIHPRVDVEPEGISRFPENKKLSTISCGPNWAAIELLTDDMDIPLIAGSGNHTWKISTTNDSAQIYFNQGINMYYSFHIIEALASFKKAVTFDPECAMLYWALALSYGPNINDLGYIASPEALKAIEKASQFYAKTNTAEKALINAMGVRYTVDSADATRAKLNAEYTTMMKVAYNQFPKHPDIQALYADAMMLEHPWDLWNNDGTPRPWTPGIQAVLEKLLASNPKHPGGNHYYIHVMEPSPYAAKALPSADILDELTPALSHTVHMPSHIYLRTGNYNRGVTVNEKAVNSYYNIRSQFSPVAANDFIYEIHNLHMQTNVAMLAGRSTYSQQSAAATAKSIPADYLLAPPPLSSAIQYIYMVPTLANIRFGKWEQLLQAEKPGAEMIYANILHHFGRGMALANQVKSTEANQELSQMQQLMKDSGLLIPFAVFSPAIESARVAENMLKGRIAQAEKKYPEAIAAFEGAVKTEEHMVYTEPRDWLLNPKQYLGNAYLLAGNPTAAETAFRKDLLVNNENGWALYGLYQALMAQNKAGDANAMLTRYKNAFAKADISLSSAVY